MADGNASTSHALLPKEIDLANEIEMLLLHLNAASAMTWGCAADAFQAMDDTLKDNYLWMMGMQIDQLSTLWKRHQDIVRDLRKLAA